jgi:hypothetical protein
MLRIVAVLAGFGVCACASVGQQDKPALLIEPTTESHAELVGVVSNGLGVETAAVAEDALMRDSMLVIDRAPARDASGQRLSGRDYDRPEQFQLVRAGSRCELVHLKTRQHYALKKVRCVPVT